MAEPRPAPVAKAQAEDAELAQRRQEQIIAAATKAFGRNGYHATTNKDIAREAGISPGLIYQYFEDKEDVLLMTLLACLDSYAREIPRATAKAQGPLARLCAAFSAYCRVVDRRKAAAVLAYSSTKSLDARRRKLVMERELETNALIADEVRACIAAGLLRAANVDIVSYQLVMMAHSWALKAWHFGPLLTLDAYVRECLDMVLGGLSTAAGKDALARDGAQGGDR